MSVGPYQEEFAGQIADPLRAGLAGNEVIVRDQVSAGSGISDKKDRFRLGAVWKRVKIAGQSAGTGRVQSLSVRLYRNVSHSFNLT